MGLLDIVTYVDVRDGDVQPALSKSSMTKTFISCFEFSRSPPPPLRSSSRISSSLPKTRPRCCVPDASPPLPRRNWGEASR